MECRLLVALCALACAGIVRAQTSVQESGLRGCFDAGGTEIVCTGTGQDGDLRPGAKWPVPRLVDNGDGTVTDRLTGLMWLKDPGCIAAVHFNLAMIRNFGLNTGTDFGCADYTPDTYEDWHIPNAVELATLIDYGSADGLPAGHPFVNVGTGDCFTWSSTTNVHQKDKAWVVAHGTASPPPGVAVASKDSSTTGCVWPVRTPLFSQAGDDVSLALADGGIVYPDGSVQSTAQFAEPSRPRRSGQTLCWNEQGDPLFCTNSGHDGETQAGVEWPLPRYVDNGSGTVSDELSRLTWLKDAECLGDDRSFDQAQTRVAEVNAGDEFACADYVAGSFDDWRMPAIGELVSLLDYGTESGLPVGHPFDFGVLSACGYWSATSDAGAPSQGWRLVHGPTALVREVQSVAKADDGCVWLVRDGS